MVLVLTALAGCSKTETPAGGGDSNNGSDDESVAGKTDLVFGITSEPKSLTPYQMDEFTGFGMSYQLYNALIELKADGTMEPSLATSWEYENDGKI